MQSIFKAQIRQRHFILAAYLRQGGDQFTMKSRLTKVEVNPTVDPSIFEMKK
jgi:hypothetical protein